VIRLADVKWIKITTDVFDDEKILLIESLPEADSIIVIWFKLLCLAGKQNNSGVFLMGDKIAYTDKMLATIFRRKETTVQLALQTFEQFGMIELIDGVITIPNWEKHQSIDRLEKIKEQTRARVAKHREKQKLLSRSVTDSVTVTQGNATDKIREDKIRIDKNRIDYQQIADLFNTLCPSYPSIKTLSDSRKKSIKARLNTYTVDDFETLFRKAEESSFLKGGNGRDWSATFDWLIKDANMAKVLDGNYDDKSSKPVDNTTNQQLKAIQERQQKDLVDINLEELKEGVF
jgi:predicted phage replisome organizer